MPSGGSFWKFFLGLNALHKVAKQILCKSSFNEVKKGQFWNTFVATDESENFAATRGALVVLKKKSIIHEPLYYIAKFWPSIKQMLLLISYILLTLFFHFMSMCCQTVAEMSQEPEYSLNKSDKILKANFFVNFWSCLKCVNMFGKNILFD